MQDCLFAALADGAYYALSSQAPDGDDTDDSRGSVSRALAVALRTRDPSPTLQAAHMSQSHVDLTNSTSAILPRPAYTNANANAINEPRAVGLAIPNAADRAVKFRSQQEVRLVRGGRGADENSGSGSCAQPAPRLELPFDLD